MENTNPLSSTIETQQVDLPLVNKPNLSQNNNKKLYFLLILIILFITAGMITIAYQNTQLSKEILRLKNDHSALNDNVITPSEDQKLTAELTPEITVEPTLSLLGNVDTKGKLIDFMAFDYDKSLFTLERGSTNNVNDGTQHKTFYPDLNLKLIGDNHGLLQIVDLSSLNQNIEDLSKAMFFSGITVQTSLRPVTVNGKSYSFTGYHFGDGAPTDNNCWSSSGVLQNQFVLDGKLAVIVSSYYTERGCEGKATERIETPDAETMEKVLKTIESIRLP